MASQGRGRQVISLAGEWQFAMKPATPIPGQPLPHIDFTETISLPGTTETNRKGASNPERETGRLTRIYPYTGAAWYQQQIVVPESWHGKQIWLLLERSKYTEAWLDDIPLGECDSLVAPHRYDLSGGIEPGAHRLTILVDNSRRPPVGDPHQLSDQTQTNWNGIIGRLELRVTDPIWIEDVRVYPDLSRSSARVSVRLGNATGQPAAGKLTLQARTWNVPKMVKGTRATVSFHFTGPEGIVETEYLLGKEALPWDEFSPALYRLTVDMTGQADAAPCSDTVSAEFGLREFKTRGSQFTINGKPTFLRGKHDACVFPLTGCPPMGVEGWIHYLKACQQYGINHIRCHTWCPPDAAFEAADRLGIYMQPELPNWAAFGESPEHDECCIREGERLLQFLGNHPSFVMFSLGNEMGGSREKMASVVSHFRDLDSSRLYAQGSNNFFWDPSRAVGDDYWTTFRTGKDARRLARGSMATVDGIGHVQSGPPNTLAEYSDAIRDIPVPVVGHEIGQYTVCPDYREISKYTGVLQARNLELFREKLDAKGMLDQAHAFHAASGALAVIAYREEVEAALRTPGFGGFQILDLQDFPGQGTALVGILDAFMSSKGLITPKRWRDSCSPTVALASFSQYSWATNETFTAEVSVAHYGPAALRGVSMSWTLAMPKAHVIAAGHHAALNIPQGTVTHLATISAPLEKVQAPTRLMLEISLSGIGVVNHYPVWVYPENVSTAVPEGVMLSKTLDAEARSMLDQGGRVLLIPRAGSVGRTVPGGFATDFWCWPMFHNTPGTMGILCNPKSPALAGFPTESHSDWQWFHIAATATPIILDDTPPDYRPIVQVIDNLERNHKLGLVFEARIGPGRLLACACDLLSLPDDPAARQLLSSLLAYAASEQFNPAISVSDTVLRAPETVSEQYDQGQSFG